MNNLNSSLPVIFRDSHSIIVQGPITIDNVVTMTHRGAALFDGHHWVIDLDKITEVDSTIISMLLEWLRATRQKGCQLQFVNMPGSVKSLIQLYGVEALIPIPVNYATQPNAT